MIDYYEKSGVKYPTDCIEVLNHGFVKLVDVMGDDSSIIQAARVSYGKGTKKLSEDRGLIRYLMRHMHTTPFEMVEFKFHCRLPIFVARQWIRHRTANVNEYSGRYSEMPDLFYVPKENVVTKQSSVNKQGGNTELVTYPKSCSVKFSNEHKKMYESYKQYLDTGMRRELARINLPLAQYTEWYWKIDAKNLLHFLSLRLDSHAQYEIQVYGKAMLEMIRPYIPLTIEAWEDYDVNAIKLTRLEVEVLQKMENNKVKMINTDNKREQNEWKEKCIKLNLILNE